MTAETPVDGSGSRDRLLEADVCPDCARLRKRGRNDRDPIHCRSCHRTWSGVEAQHCVRCHMTFSSITAADHHRYRRLPNGATDDCCIDPPATEGWRELRRGVWTDSERWDGEVATKPCSLDGRSDA